MKTSLRIYNKIDSNLFDLFGHNEVAQTKGLAYLISESTEAYTKLIQLIGLKGVKKDSSIIVDAEYITQKKQRPDVVITFYDKNYKLYKAVILEAKTASKMITQLNAQQQLENYCIQLQKELNINNVELVTLTNIISFYNLPAKRIFCSITWIDLITVLYTCKNSLAQEYVNYLIRILNK